MGKSVKLILVTFAPTTACHAALHRIMSSLDRELITLLLLFEECDEECPFAADTALYLCSSVLMFEIMRHDRVR